MFTAEGGGAEIVQMRVGRRICTMWGWGAESLWNRFGEQNLYGWGWGAESLRMREQNLYGWGWGAESLRMRVWSRIFMDEGGEQNLWGWGSSAITPNLISIWSWEMALVWNPVGLQFKLTIETFVSRFNLHCQKEFKFSTSVISLFCSWNKLTILFVFYKDCHFNL